MTYSDETPSERQHRERKTKGEQLTFKIKDLPPSKRYAEIDKIVSEHVSGEYDAAGKLLDDSNAWAQECERFVNQTQPLVEMNLTAILNSVHTSHGKMIVVNYTKVCKFPCVRETDDGYFIDVNKLTVSEYETLVALNSTVVDFVKNGTN